MAKGTGSDKSSHVNGHSHDSWEKLLLTNSKGDIRERSAQNALILFGHAPEVAGSLYFDTFSEIACTKQPLPWDIPGYSYPRSISDTDGIQALGWLEKQGLHKLSVGVAKDALIAVAKRRPFNPLVNWLHLIAWDRQPRVNGWLTYYLGVEPTPYTKAVGAKFLIGAVARAMQPGCKLDTMLILEGPQGQRKSTAARTLFSPAWFTDDLAEFGTKDAALQMLGRWGIEVSEMASFTNAETSKIKAVLSRQVDRFRAPYDRFPTEHPRQCVFIGTTNPIDGYFKDPTGARRFWPVSCGQIDISALANDREQLWAEAVVRYEGGEQWWLDENETLSAKAEQEDRREIDPWEARIHLRAGNTRQMTLGAVLSDWLDIPMKEQNKFLQMRVANILKSMGWNRTQARVDGRNEKVWRAPEVATVVAGGYELSLTEQ
jgi:predicted P-loop ATPase